VSALLDAVRAAPRARVAVVALLATAAAAAALAALGPGDLGPPAARGLLAVAGLAALAALARRRPRAREQAPRLAVVERALLGRDGGVALLEADGRRLVVGFGPGGAQLLADLGGGSRAAHVVEAAP